MTYLYKGDKLTDPMWIGQTCTAVRRQDGKCIRGKNGSMLVDFGGVIVNVVARQLRKVEQRFKSPYGKRMRINS